MRWTLIKTKKLPQARLMQLMKHHGIDAVFDVGANVGQYGESLRKGGYKNRIISFEPTSAAYAKITQACESDALWELAPQQAIGDEAGEVEINVSTDTDMSSILDLEESTLETLPGSCVDIKETVKVQRIADVFHEFSHNAQNPFLKVDTQGFEWQVLQGAEDVLSRFKGIQLELSLLPMYKGEKTFDEITTWLRERGFVPHLIMPGYFSRKLNRQMQIDIIFIRQK